MTHQNSPEYIEIATVGKTHDTDSRYFSFISYLETNNGRGRFERTLLFDYCTDEIVYAIRPRGGRSYRVIERRSAVGNNKLY
jgi:hypothetical protein